MTEFTYVAVQSDGTKLQGNREAETREQLVQSLSAQGLTVITVRENFSIQWQKILQAEIGGIPLKERVLIAKQLATMISAGIPIIQAIGILANQAEKQAMQEKLEEVYKKIESGFPLSQAFRDAGGIFSDIQLNLIAAGEKSGNLNEMLQKVAEDMDKSRKLRGKLLGALIYPVIIFAILIVVVIIMIVFMVPQISNLYASIDPDASLPFITQMLVELANVFRSPLFIIGTIILAIGGFLGYRFYVSDAERKVGVDTVKMKIPVFGNLIQKVQLAEFCRLTAMLVKSGISILDTITIVAEASGNAVFEKILLQSRTEVSKGSAFSIALAKHNIKEAFTPILIRIISTGEESGKIDGVLEDMYKFYDDEVEQMTSNLTKLLEPFILVIVGSLVALLAVAIYLPIYNVGNLV